MPRFIVQIFATAIAISGAAPAFAQQVTSAPGVTLTEAAQEKFNHNAGRDNQQWIITVPGMSSEMSRAQLAAAAGLTPEEARGMTVGALFTAKVNRESGRDEQLSETFGAVSMSTRAPFLADPQLLAAAGLTEQEAMGLSLSEIAAAKVNRDASRDERIGR